MYDNEDYDFGADLSNVDETEFDTIPPGKYLMQCIKTELKDTQAGGKMVSARFQVTQGDYENRLIFENFNIQHSNPRTVNIALGQIKQWLSACGQNPNQRLTMNLLRGLEGIEFLANVRIQKDKTGQYGDQNRISKYESFGHPVAIPQQQVQHQPVNQQQAPGQQAPVPQPPIQTAPAQQQPPANQQQGPLPWQNK